MRHSEAIRHLPDLLTGTLTGDRQTETAEHLAGCDSCQGWAETYRFFSDALLADDAAEHPSSEQLAHLAVDAELLTEPERERLASHLEGCDECRRELRLSREALAGARQGPAATRLLPFRLVSRPAALRLALAASLILAVAVTFVVSRRDGAGNEIAAAPVAIAAAPPAAVIARIAAVDRALAGNRLTGIQVIEASGAITASSVAIESGGDITLRAGEMVVLGDGFSIGSTATLGVEITPRTSDEQELHDHS